jgi:hypothetical protein
VTVRVATQNVAIGVLGVLTFATFAKKGEWDEMKGCVL